MSDIEAEVSTLPAREGWCQADGPIAHTPNWLIESQQRATDRALRPEPTAPDVEDSIAEVAAADNARRLEQMRRVRRAAVNRVIDLVRIEQLGLNGPNDRTSVEELTHDAIMKSLDLYFEGRPKASPDSMSMAIDTLERIQGIGPTPVQRAQMKGGK